MKMRNEVVTLALATMILLSMFLSSLPLISAAYTVENPYMPYPGEPVCAMKTEEDGHFYIPNTTETDLLKIEMLFDNQNLTGDQTGGTSPYDSIEYYPDGYVDITDQYFVALHYGTEEGDEAWEYMADIVPPYRFVDISDLYTVALNYGKYGNYTDDLSGITITFNTGEERTPDNDGFVTIPQNTTAFCVECYGNPVGVMITFWLIGNPIAYSTTFEFTVPPYVGDDIYKTVYYYVLARVYVPSELSGENFNFSASADASVQDVKFNNVAKAGSGSSVNIDLGALSGGYHLLEFEFVEVAGNGWVNFHVATGTEEYAWLPRFRIYVPDYSDMGYEYTVKTKTYFPIKDRYFLIGYADDYIDDVLVNGWAWQDWEWDMGEYGAIHAWGDGFCYPLGEIQKTSCIASFTFGEIGDVGQLDFQYISFTYQTSKIGKPKFRAETSITKDPDSPICFYNWEFFGGSDWSGNPGLSNRYIAVSHDISVAGPTYDGEFGLQVGLGWAPLKSSDYIDFGIMFKLKYSHCYNLLAVIVKNLYADIYTPGQALTLIPGNVLEFADPENPEVQSVISPEFRVLIEVLSSIPAVIGAVKAGPIGAIAGTVVGGATKELIYHYLEGQEVKPVQDEGGTSTHDTISYGDNCLVLGILQDSDNHLIFVQLKRNDVLRCGTVKVVASGKIEITGIYVPPPPAPAIPITHILNFETTIYIPWFLTE